MKKTTLIILSAIIIASCSSAKRTEQALSTGNYDQAITTAIRKLRTKKDRKGKQPLIIMLESAYGKAQRRDHETIEYLKKDGNPANLERIYNTYLDLDARQERIKPLLPLYIIDKGANASFPFRNYDSDLINTKNQLSDFLYNNAKNLLVSPNNKIDYRKAYDDFAYLDKLNPGFKDVRDLMQEAHVKGTDFVYVKMKNETNQIIPQRLQDDLLNFGTFGLNDLWTVYHNTKEPRVQYDFGMKIELRDINISPERVYEKQVIREKQVKDGWEYLLDENGNEVRDSLGNAIKVDKFVTVTCSVLEFTQSKATQVVGNVSYHNFNTNQLIDTYPISSEFVFEHHYATYNGDKRALDDPYINMITLRPVPFPTNEQMVYDTGEDLKQKIKSIITRNKFRR
ncbi:MAG: hypothetical protein HRT68_10700 [Flavobacteriaceae bacterium]|nr:hypothetical protein [Flavobacteriaceae bacterium]